MQKKQKLYQGKSKNIYSTNDPNFLILYFRNDISANNGKIISSFEHKGELNNKFNYFFMNKLKNLGIDTHLEKLISSNEILVKKLQMIPLEFVIRNYSSGSLVRRIGIQEGILLNPPIFEIFLKNDEQCDPMINDSYCETFSFISKQNLINVKKIIFNINKILVELFDRSDLILIDFKLEFGILNNKIILGDEFSPDGSRIWDKKTKNKMDKDLFRHNKTGLIDAYKKLANRFGI